MAFYEVLFPTSISYGATGGPGFLTHIVSTQAGYEYRSGEWAAQRCQYNVSFGIQQAQGTVTAGVRALTSFFLAVGGRANGFRFLDWNDYSDWGAGTFQTNPENNTLQLCKTYTGPAPLVGSTQPTYQRFIFKPVPGSLTLPGGVTVDYTTGFVTGGSVGQTWTGQFHVPVRFDIDKLDFKIEQPDGSSAGSVASSWPSIPIVEMKL